MSNPALWLPMALGGRQTSSGETVNADTAMELSVYYACIRNIAEDVGRVPLLVYKRLPNGGKERATDHPLYKVLHDEPNPEMSAMTFRSTMTHHMLGTGNAYAEVERKGSGEILYLHPIPPSRVTVKRNVKGKIEYHIKNQRNSETSVLSTENMFHLRGLGGDGLIGYSVVRLAAESIGMGLATQKYGNSLFANGTVIGGVLTHPAKLNPEAHKRLRDSWEERHKGSENAHKVAILEEGMKFEQTSIPPEEAQFLESRQFTVEDICRWFRMPPHLVQHLLRATFSNIAHQSIEYVTYTLGSPGMYWQQEIKRTLISEDDKETYFAEHEWKALLQGDPVQQAQFYKEMVVNGMMSVNEVRERENLNPIEGGDKHLIQMNMTTLEKAGAETEVEPVTTVAPPIPSTPNEQEAKNIIVAAHTPLVRSLVTRLLAKEIRAVSNIVKKFSSIDTRHTEKVKTLLEEFYIEQRSYIITTLSPWFDTMMELLQVDILEKTFHSHVDEYIRVQKHEAFRAWSCGEVDKVCKVWEIVALDALQLRVMSVVMEAILHEPQS